MPDSHPHILPAPFLGSGARLDHVSDAPGLVCEPHHHLYHEFDYVLKGQGVFVVGKRKTEVGPGDLVYLGRAVHHWRKSNPSQPMTLCNWTIDDLMMRHVLEKQPEGVSREWPWWYHWSASELEDEKIKAFLKQIVRRMRQSPGQQPPAISSKLLSGIAYLLNRGTLYQSMELDLHALAKRIRHAPHQRLSLDEEAERLGVSRWWLSRIFRRQFGVTLWEHRNCARTDLAIYRLLRSDISVQKLGEELGFSSTAHFISTFKRLAGMTPARLRRRYRDT